MKKYLILLLLVSTVFSLTTLAQNQKLAQTGLKFLSVATYPRAVGMGEAVTSLDGDLHHSSLIRQAWRG